MPTEFAIAKSPVAEPALDQRQLYDQGMAYALRLARRLWTDHNVHDPGSTILELLCYALTDLSYRASLPMADLLATASDNETNMAQQFFTTRQILPNRAWTALDYRKLLIDLPGVKNAWLKPAALTYYADTRKADSWTIHPKPLQGTGIQPVTIQGLYHVLIDYMDGLNNPQKKAVLDKVKIRLHANRNLCEDFVDFGEVPTEAFQLCGEFELTAQADVTQVHAEILFQVQNYLAPPVFNYTLDQMLERPKPDATRYRVDEIFDGPILDTGFIPDDELKQAELRSEIRLSDLINIIMDIEGVQAVREIVINPLASKTPLVDKWVVPIKSGHKALLEELKSRLVFYKRAMPVVSNPQTLAAKLAALKKALAEKLETPVSYDLPIPVGRYRKLGEYYSVQNHFPAVYGLSEFGLDGQADDARKGLAKQLKAYLLFFDQLMANYFAQLNHVRDLFSTDSTLLRTYFYQEVNSFSESDKIYASSDFIKTLEENIEDSSDKALLIERRNRFLDHLISRFAERFTDFANVTYSAFQTSGASLVDYKCEFLKSYVEISSERGLAYDYSQIADNQLWDTDNVSGLEKRLARLLGTRDWRRRNLADVSYEIYPEIDQTPNDEFRFRLRKKADNQILLSSSTNYVDKSAALAEFALAIDRALLPAGYQRKKTKNNKHYFNIIDDTGEVIARRIEYFDSQAKMETAITELIDYIKNNKDYILGRYSDEGMYLIENILLRYEQDGDPMLPICVEPGCTGCPELDPYSYRIHIVMPAYTSRFSHMAFRQYAEQVIREEVPAHILPKICWVDKEQMAVFETAYRNWIYLKSGKNTALRKQKLTQFITLLYELKNIYPSAQLYACDADEDKMKFVLGLSALGSQDNKPK